MRICFIQKKKNILKKFFFRNYIEILYLCSIAFCLNILWSLELLDFFSMECHVGIMAFDRRYVWKRFTKAWSQVAQIGS